LETQPSASRQASVRDLVAVIFRQKWVIITVVGVTTLSVFLLNLRTPTTYESTAKVRVERGRKETTLQPNLRILPWSEEISSELETVTSYPVARQAQELLDNWYRDGKVSRPIRFNRGGTSAQVIGESNVINISYTSQDASVCRPVADAVTEAYTIFRSQSMSIPEATSFFEERITQSQKDLDNLEKEKESYLAKVGTGGARTRQEEVGNLLSLAERDLMEVQGKVSGLRQQLATAKKLVAEGNYDATYFTELKFENVYTLNALRQKVMEARLNHDELAATLTPEHPQLIVAQQSLVSAEDMLKREVLATVDLIQSQLQEKEAQTRELKTQIAGYRKEVVSIPQYVVELDRFDNLIRLKRDELRDLKSKQLLSQVNQATSPDYTVTLLSPASAPSPKKPL
jgi:uncharacterized protein involved in exopolysaccharide biosynthesis